MKVAWDPKLLVVERGGTTWVIRASGASSRGARIPADRLARLVALAQPIIGADLMNGIGDESIRFTLYQRGKKYVTTVTRDVERGHETWYGPLRELLVALRE